MTVYAITDTKKGRTGIAPTYLHTTPNFYFGLRLRLGVRVRVWVKTPLFAIAPLKLHASPCCLTALSAISPEL